ncbi:LpqN/LpqT family lipoprotein [Mycobacterium sp. CVI_P3]|uniref:LpqN/LpqT family lipoprotein n=1 Tax=Mycobacterium pinniadriaticum TaxID=2994102 RepID=A0ABT3S8B3_9MYCO|nr:LpqN/LpqT family lipoprotein [Mycobacterium pinniadriaticum]MCX2929310.1 LpqN/LpqT family lipoprotein [Mycobacterium pinniadriaticum]MCX2935734.1 LpqN/LpqT family lipoprotein [Mycobacterium pinniadriaticum]
MITITRNWRVVVGGVAAGTAAVLGFAGANASAEPVLPAPPAPAPVTVTQTVTVAPEAAAANLAPAATPAVAPAAGQVATAPAAGQVATLPAAAPVATAPETLVPAESGTLTEYFKDKGVEMEPQKAAGFTAINLVLPMPRGWSVVPDPNVPDAFTVLADRLGGDGLYTSNAQLKVYKLVGDFDPKEAITHGYLDSQQLFNWQPTDASMADFDGFPSSIIEGTYRENDMTLNTSRRHVIVPSGTDHYLVSLYVTTAANQVVATADATDAIVNGFRVTSPTAGPAPAQAPAPEPAAAAPLADAAAPAAVPVVPVPQH